MGGSSGCMGDTSVKNSKARKGEASQYNAAKLDVPRKNMAALMLADTARKKVVNRTVRLISFSIVPVCMAITADLFPYLLISHHVATSE